MTTTNGIENKKANKYYIKDQIIDLVMRQQIASIRLNLAEFQHSVVRDTTKKSKYAIMKTPTSNEIAATSNARLYTLLIIHIIIHIIKTR